MTRRVLVFCLLALFPAIGQAASFDCAKAKSPVEKAICGDDYLSSLDSQVGRLYRTAGANAGLQAEQRQWIRDNAAQCADEITKCLVGRYTERRLALIEIVQKAALDRAPESRSGPFSFRDVDIQFADDAARIRISYVVMTGQPAEIADAFNEIAVPWKKSFLDPCEEQSLKVDIDRATERMVALRTEFSMYCEGAAHAYDSISGTTIAMRPKPHLLGPADLFRPGTPWQQVLSEKSIEALKTKMPLHPGEERVALRMLVDPRDWLVTPGGLKIQFGYLNGYANGEIETEIAWDQLDGLLVADPPFRDQ